MTDRPSLNAVLPVGWCTGRCASRAATEDGPVPILVLEARA